MPDLIGLAKALDAKDELRHFRDRFVVQEPDRIYLDGNSLGRLPKGTAEYVQSAIIDQWGRDLVSSWPTEWVDLPQALGAKIAPLIGAHADEVIVCDSTTVNLFKLVMAAIELKSDASHLVTDHQNFPSDLYVLQNIARLKGMKVVDQLSPESAVYTASHVAFKTGEILDMAAITAKAHQFGCPVIWDLSHSVGAIPVDLGACNADFAVGCTYKYLNAGPGANAFLYVRRDLQARLFNPIGGWFGCENAFEFNSEYTPRPGVARFLSGTPNVLSLLPISVGVDLINEAGIERLRAKSLRQTDFLIEIWRNELEPLGLSLNTPLEHHRRGSHVSLGHPDALAIDLALVRDEIVIPDFRTPDNIRFGVTPIYTTFEEIATAMIRLRDTVSTGRYKKYLGEIPSVT